MESPYKTFESVTEEGWQIIGNDWWQTPYQSISWAFSPDHNAFLNAKSHNFLGGLFQPAGSPARSSPDAFLSKNRSTDTDLVLNPKLCGVQCAMDVVTPYEAFVGIISTQPAQLRPSPSARRRDISIQVTDHELGLTREIWEKRVEDLFTVPPSPLSDIFSNEQISGRSSPSLSPADLYQSVSTLSSLDLTDSDLSCNSVSRPSTPKRKSLGPIVQVKDGSPIKPFSGRPLNASASSFVPASVAKLDTHHDPSSPQPGFINFTFPSLEVPPAPPIKLKKDEQGFYSKDEVEPPVPDVAFLPPFLQRSSRRKPLASKTRAIIDRFRSLQNQGLGANQSQCPTPNPPFYDYSYLEERVSVSDDGGNRSGKTSPSSLDDDGEGWVNCSEASSDSKARQTRNLFLAFTRRRSGSSSPTDRSSGGDQKDLDPPTPPSPVPGTSPSSSYSSNDGWVESQLLSSSPKPEPKAAPLPRPNAESRSRRRRRASQALSATAPPVSAPALAPAPFINTPPTNSVPLPLLPPLPPPFIPSQFGPHPPPPPYVFAGYPTIVPQSLAYTTYMHQQQFQQMHQMCSAGAGAGAGPGPGPVPASATTTDVTKTGTGMSGASTTTASVHGGGQQFFSFHNPLAAGKSFTTPPMPPLSVMNMTLSTPPVAPIARRGSLW